MPCLALPRPALHAFDGLDACLPLRNLAAGAACMHADTSHTPTHTCTHTPSPYPSPLPTPPPKKTTTPKPTKTPQEATLKFNEDFSRLQAGDWVDVLCERNRVWYEARVVERRGEEVKVRPSFLPFCPFFVSSC